MAKDRLGDLIKARDGKSGNLKVEIAEETMPLTGGTDLRQTFERAEVLGEWINKIEENVATIKQCLNKIDDIKVNQKDLNDKIDSLFQTNNSISHQIQPKLKEFEEELKSIDNSSAQGRIKNIQYTTLKTRYQKVFRLNTAELETYRNIKKSQLESQLRAKGVTITDEELVRLIEEKADIQLFTENILAETQEAKLILRDIEERHQQLLKIERMIEDVRDLFLQMAILIDNQQELIDRVEYQAELAQEYVVRGREDLKSGERKRKKYIKRKIIFIIVVVVLIALILALILK